MNICVNPRDQRAICDGAMAICVYLCDLWFAMALRLCASAPLHLCASAPLR